MWCMSHSHNKRYKYKFTSSDHTHVHDDHIISACLLFLHRTAESITHHSTNYSFISSNNTHTHDPWIPETYGIICKNVVTSGCTYTVAQWKYYHDNVCLFMRTTHFIFPYVEESVTISILLTIVQCFILDKYYISKMLVAKCCMLDIYIEKQLISTCSISLNDQMPFLDTHSCTYPEGQYNFQSH